VVVLLKERGIRRIVIGEGMFTWDALDRETPAHAYETLGYGVLKKRYGIEYLNLLERPFEKVDLGDGVVLKISRDILESDFVVDIPVMKAHNQTIVSLGIKNLKGTLDRESRKRCHNADPRTDLHFRIARLPDKLPPILSVLDGIYTCERGPGVDGRMHRSNLLVASADVLSADLVGAKVLGYEPSQVPHLVHAAKNRNRPLDLSDIKIAGERIEDVAAFHDYDFHYSETEEGTLPTPMAKQGIQGLYYRKYDSTMCTYCSALNGVILTAIRYVWEGKRFPDVEVLNGKVMKPTPGRHKTILLGKCMVKANKGHPDIREAIPIPGCPPKPKDVVAGLHRAGIAVNPDIFERLEELPGFFMRAYEGRPEFDESFFRVE